MPLIWAPVAPSIPSGLRMKSIVAIETICASTAIMKRWKRSSGLCPGCGSVDWPRVAIRFVTRANALFPASVNSIARRRRRGTGPRRRACSKLAEWPGRAHIRATA